jgi:hypothetical protein
MLFNQAESRANSTALIEYLRKFRKFRNPKINAILEEWLSYNTDCAIAILRRAHNEKHSGAKQHHNNQRKQPTPQRVYQQIEELTNCWQLNHAAKQSEKLEQLLCGTFDNIHPLTTDKKISKLSELHPSATKDDNFILQDSDDGIPEGAVVTSAVLDNVLRTLNSSKTSGPSGWNFHFIKVLYLRAHDSHWLSFRGKYQCFQGKISTSVAQLWAGSRADLLPKTGEPDKYRPLGIGDALSYMARTVAQIVGSNVSEILNPLQRGSGISGGLEIAVRSIQLALNLSKKDDPISIIKLDQRNAFNTASRGVIYRFLRERLPQLLHFFKSFYSFSLE